MDLKKSTKSVSKPQIWPKSQIFLRQCSLFSITQNLWNFHRDTACTTEVTEKCHFLAFSKTSRLFETVQEKMSPDIRKHSPDMVVLHVGLNDCRDEDYNHIHSALNEYKILLGHLMSLDIIPIVSFLVL